MTPLIPDGSMLQNYYGRLAAEAAGRRRAEWKAVDTPESRGRGLGKQLIQWALDEFAKRNLRHAQLKVVIGNDDSIAFYQHCGFKPRAFCMVKKLK